MALLTKRLAVYSMNIGRKYSTVTRQTSPYTDLPIDRVFENSKTGTRFVMTNDYSVAKKGINDRNEFVMYYPEKFMPSYNKRYEEMKSSGIDFITKFNIAKPGTERFREIVNIRVDAMSAMTLLVDTPNTDNTEFARAFHTCILFYIIHDDFMIKLIPQQLSKFEQQYIDKLKAVQRLNDPQLFNANDPHLSIEETQLLDEANNLILALYDSCSRLRKYCSAKVYENFCVGSNMFYEYTAIENSHIRKNRPLTWTEFRNVSAYQTAGHGLWAINDHTEPLLSLYDPFLTLGMIYNRMWNDVLSYYKESQTLEKACSNSVSVLMSMDPNLTTMQAMTEVMRVQNKILEDALIYVEYLRDEEKKKYTTLFTHCIGFNEAQLLGKRFGWNLISGTPSKYATMEHNGVIYGNDDY